MRDQSSEFVISLLNSCSKIFSAFSLCPNILERSKINYVRRKATLKARVSSPGPDFGIFEQGSAGRKLCQKGAII